VQGVAVGSTQQVQQRASSKRGQEPLTHAAGPSSARNGQPDAATSQLAQELSGGALQVKIVLLSQHLFSLYANIGSHKKCTLQMILSLFSKLELFCFNSMRTDNLKLRI